MQPLRYSSLAFAVVLALMLPTSAAAQAPLGTWQQDLARSMQNPAPQGAPPRMATVRTFENWDNGLVFVKNDGVDGEGNPTGNRIVFRRDGRDYPIATRNAPGLLTIAFTVTNVNPWAAEYTTKMDGKVTGTATETISADGRTMTVMVKNANGSTAKQIWVKQ